MGIKFGRFAIKSIWRFLNLADFDPQDRRCHKKAVGVVDGQGEEDFLEALWAVTSPQRSCSQHAALPSTSADFSLLAVVSSTVKFVVTQVGPFSAVYLLIFAL